MINSQDIKKGTCIRLDGKLYFCVDFLHVKPGKGNTIMRTTLKDVVKGGQIERRFNIGEKLEDVRVERRPYQLTGVQTCALPIYGRRALSFHEPRDIRRRDHRQKLDQRR